jgi:hypothetical protein
MSEPSNEATAVCLMLVAALASMPRRNLIVSERPAVSRRHYAALVDRSERRTRRPFELVDVY